MTIDTSSFDSTRHRYEVLLPPTHSHRLLAEGKKEGGACLGWCAPCRHVLCLRGRDRALQAKKKLGRGGGHFQDRHPSLAFGGDWANAKMGGAASPVQTRGSSERGRRVCLANPHPGSTCSPPILFYFFLGRLATKKGGRLFSVGEIAAPPTTTRRVRSRATELPMRAMGTRARRHARVHAHACRRR